MPTPHIRITLNQPVDPDRLAAAVLGCVTVLQLAGLGDIATVHQDHDLVTDEQLAQLADQWADANPWS